MRTAPLGMIFAAACKCLSVPTADTTPPAAGVIVEYREPGGPRVSKTVGVGSPDVSVTAAKNDVVTVMYNGSDNEGVRKADLVYDMYYYSGNSLIQPLLAAVGVSASCPKALVLGSKNFEPDNHPWHFQFSSRATNWLGQTATSGKITVKLQ
jgi:hypothetical protein